MIGLYTTAYGQMVLAFDRFAAVFLWRRYKILFSARNCMLMWLLIVNGFPLAFFFPTMINAVGGFVSHPGYCLCMPEPPNVGSPLWNLSVPVLIIIPVSLSLLVYAAIYARIRLARRRVVGISTISAAAQPNAAVNGHQATTMNTVNRRARNSLVFFVNVMVTLVCFSSMAATTNSGSVEVDKMGAQPILLLLFCMTQMGVSLVSQTKAHVGCTACVIPKCKM